MNTLCEHPTQQARRRLYSIWHNMKTRCYNPRTQHYNRYGGRGITVCSEWKNNFLSFYEWAIRNGYAENLTLDRKDNDGNYEPSNCQWSDRYYQNSHTRQNRYITHHGETKIATEWAREYGIDPNVFRIRFRRGWPFERAIKPVKKRKTKQP